MFGDGIRKEHPEKAGHPVEEVTHPVKGRCGEAAEQKTLSV
jgi:hypothetical protein